MEAMVSVFRTSSRAVAALLPVAALLVALTPAVAQSNRAEIEAVVKDYLAKNPETVQRIVKDYLANNPEVLHEALLEIIKRRAGTAQAPAAPDKSAAIKTNASAIFASPHQVTLGNRAGDVTLVEFFDYNCGFCKRALADKLELLKTDPKLKVVLKEFPVLGQGSVEAAQVAVAVRMQDPGGARYLEFHQKLLTGRGPANKANALEVAKEVGLDVARIERDLDSAEIKDTLDEGRKLAALLGINGTPSYVIGEQVVPGAVGLATLTDRIKTARK